MVGKTVVLGGMSLRLVIIKNPNPRSKDKLIYLFSSIDEYLQKIACKYPIRWQIELCFKHLKSNSFELEKINLEDVAKQRLITITLMFAYTLSIREGLKNYKLQIPIYRGKGLDDLSLRCYDLVQFCSYLIENLHLRKSKYRSPYVIYVQ